MIINSSIRLHEYIFGLDLDCNTLVGASSQQSGYVRRGLTRENVVGVEHGGFGGEGRNARHGSGHRCFPSLLLLARVRRGVSRRIHHSEAWVRSRSSTLMKRRQI